jgi:CDP-diacylglycerol--glycerol-3-phosphate 3-phosphatidyltransferase
MSRYGDRFVQGPMYFFTGPLVRWLVRSRIGPNALTTAGCAVTLTAALFFYLGHVRTGGFLVLIGGIFDILDGRVARDGRRMSTVGAFYDSTLDRFSEMAVFVGIASLYVSRAGSAASGMIYAVMLAMGGSLMVSYTRARAEALGLDCRGGLMERAERILLLGAGAWGFGLDFRGLVLDGVIITMAVLTLYTAGQRVVQVLRRGDPTA